MSRRIDAEWLMKYFKRGKEYKGEYVLDDLKYEAPSIDIVRCGECMYWHKNRKEGDVRNVFDVCYDFQADDFCSYGEEGE